jgi:hypothetical protein
MEPFENLLNFLVKSDISPNVKEKLNKMYTSLRSESGINTSQNQLIFNKTFDGIDHITECLSKHTTFELVDSDTKDIVFYMYCFICLLNIMNIDNNTITIPPLPQKINDYNYVNIFKKEEIQEFINYVLQHKNNFNNMNLNNTTIKEKFRTVLFNKLTEINDASASASPSASPSAASENKAEIKKHLYNYFCFAYMFDEKHQDRSDYMKYIKYVHDKEYNSEINKKILVDLNDNTFNLSAPVSSNAV